MTPAWIAAALILGGCSGDDFARPPCRSTLGELELKLSIAGCPSIAEFAILPNEVDVGGTVQLYSTVATSIGEKPEYAWTASGGVIADPSSAVATLTCTAPGPIQVALNVTSTAAGRNCSMIAEGSVQCDPVGPGSAAGTSDAGMSDATSE